MRTVTKLKLTIPDGDDTSLSINEALNSTTAGKAALGPATRITVYPPASPAGTAVTLETTGDDGATWLTATDDLGADVALSTTKITNMPFTVLGDDARIKSDTNASGDEDWIVFIQQD